MDWELIWWFSLGTIATFTFIGLLLPWNDQYNPKGEDPYRYCPKEEE